MESDGPDAGNGGIRRRRRLILWILATVLVSGMGLGATHWIRSPQQALADAAAPPPTMLTAPVERRVLTDTVVLRGQVSAASTVEMTPAGSGSEKAVVTALPVAVGQELHPGSVVVEVAGRPLVVLPGAIPAYRDLRPGAKGKDVEQLQRALAALGFKPGPVNGEMGSATRDALRAFYDSIGYQVATAGDSAALDSTKERVRTAQRAVTDATAHLADLRHPADPEATPPAASAVRDAQRQVTYAKEDLASAQQALTEAERTSGPMLPLAEVAFLPDFPARVTRLNAVLGGPVAAPLVTVGSGPLLVRAQLDPARRGLVTTGMPVQIYAEVLGARATGALATIGEVRVDPTSNVRSHPITVTPDQQFDPSFAGQDVRLSIQAASTGAEVLVVPVSAVFAGADGQTAVLRLEPDGTTKRVPITVGVTGDGYVELKVGPGELSNGDRVVVGTQPARQADTPTSRS